MEYKGIIQRVFANNVRGKTLHSFTLKGTDGFFNTSSTAIGFKEGDSVVFTAVAGKRPGSFEVDVASVNAGNTEETTVSNQYIPPQRPTGARRSGGMMTKDQYWERKEERDVENQRIIALQSCRNSAIALLHAGGLGTFKTPEEFIEVWTDRFLDDNATRYATEVEVSIPKLGGAGSTDEWS